MNYKKIYNNIINNRKLNPLEKHKGVYTETHHIKPRCLFDVSINHDIINNINNLVELTPREHFICHCLLAKMYKKGTTNRFKMNLAVIRMKKSSKSKSNYYCNSRLYENRKNDYWIEYNINSELKTLDRIKEICDWIGENERLPTKSKCRPSSERKLRQKIQDLKRAKNCKDKRPFHESYQILVEQLGYPTLFN